MNILFVHNNFPAQYRFLVRALLREAGYNLVAVGSPTAWPAAPKPNPSSTVPSASTRRAVAAGSDQVVSSC